MTRDCINKVDSFCYICGNFTSKSDIRTISSLIKTAYFLYFGCKIGDQDKQWAPEICCQSCNTRLIKWIHKQRGGSMPFAVPMVWRKPSDHVTDCYSGLTPKLSQSGLNKKKAKLIEYPNLPSAIRPVSHDESMPVPKAPDEYNLLSDDVCLDSVIGEQLDESPGNTDDTREDFETVHYPPEKQPHLISQGELNDLVCNLDLTKTKAEILGSRLQQWNLLETSFRDRSKRSVSFFSMSNNNLVSCNDIHGSFEELGVPYNPSNWRLLIYASTYSLKAVLVHNGNKLPSIPVGHAVGMKETYENVKQLLSDIKYDDHKWKICCDLKMVAIILGFQTGYTNYMCFL